METLWQHWTKKKEEKQVVSPIHNELGFKSGQILSLDVLDYRARDYTVLAIEEHLRTIDGKTFYSTDYVLEDELRLRACDFATNKSCWLLHLHDEFAFDENFVFVIQDALTSHFAFDDEGIAFTPVGNLTKPTKIHVLNDLSEESTLSLWTFEREAKDEAGQPFCELLFIEQDEETGWFRLWRGSEIAIEHVFVL